MAAALCHQQQPAAAAPPIVCIVSSAAVASGAVDEGRLRAAGLRTRVSALSPGADVLFSRAGTTLAFLLLTGATAGGDAGARVETLAKSFARGYVLLPDSALASTAAPLAARFGAEPSLCFVYLPMLADPTAQALSIALAALAGAAEEPGWRAHQEATVASSEAVALALTGLPLPPGTDKEHTANMLRMLGSIQRLSQQGPAEIAAATDLSLADAAALVSFFRRPAGAPAAAPPTHLARAQHRPLLRSL